MGKTGGKTHRKPTEKLPGKCLRQRLTPPGNCPVQSLTPPQGNKRTVSFRPLRPLLALLIWMLYPLCGLAQQPMSSQVLPPTPAAAAVEKFLGYPVSPATGLLDMSIPLYTMDYYGVSIPIELKYHSGGVRVQDPIGFTGRGWTLTPGLRISRTVMGKADEKYQVTDNAVGLSTEDQFALAAAPGGMECCSDRGLPTRYLDGQYDIFTIQMPGMEGSFLLHRSGNSFTAEMIPGQPLQVTPLASMSTTNPTGNEIYGFRIKDDQGHTYHFGNTSASTSGTYNERGHGGAPGGCNVGWMLRQIVFSNGEKIDFTYRRLNQTYPNYTHAVVVTDREVRYRSDCGWTDETNPITRTGYSQTGGSESSSNYTTCYPATITTPLGTLTFAYNTQDWLTSLLVKNNENAQVCSVTLSYNTTNQLLTKVATAGSDLYKRGFYSPDQKE